MTTNKQRRDVAIRKSPFREIGIDIYTLICIKKITNKNVLYKKINKIQKFKKKT